MFLTMKLIDKLEAITNSINELKQKVETSDSTEEVSNALKELDTLKSQRREIEQELETNNTNEKGMVMNYLETSQSVKDFAELHKNSKTTEEFHNAWQKKLAENNISITDTEHVLPKKIELEIQTLLTRSNEVFPLFKITNAGAQLVTREFTSEDEAHVHVPGTEKVVQNASLRLSAIQPQMIYKRQMIDERDRRLINNFSEYYTLIIDELSQRVIDKIVDLALVEGSATGAESNPADKENGFISILNETDTKKVKHIDGTTSFVDAVEQAVDETTNGKKYLILTLKQKRALLKDLHTKYPNMLHISNINALAEEFGLDGVVIYRGSKKIKPVVLVEGAYAIDMQPLVRYEQFKISTNQNDILVETPATGRPVQFEGIAVIDLAE